MKKQLKDTEMGDKIYDPAQDKWRTKAEIFFMNKLQIEEIPHNRIILDAFEIIEMIEEYADQSEGKDMYPKWKKPDEKPEIGKLVLLKVTNNKAFMGYYHKYGYWIIISKDSSYKENDLHQVTAWAYVPEW